MTVYAVLNYYYHSKTAQAILLYISIHTLTCTTSRINSSVTANALKVGLENLGLKEAITQHYRICNIVSIFSVQ